jgi:hypothetical protein
MLQQTRLSRSEWEEVETHCQIIDFLVEMYVFMYVK